MKERVVFRKEFDPYMKIWKYLLESKRPPVERICG